ncbi:MAG: family 16 glycosylhydrolase, partial [Mycobacterium sp.]|nr:family 16 glycosylhydrolase [Mycobacterium sp.]
MPQITRRQALTGLAASAAVVAVPGRSRAGTAAGPYPASDPMNTGGWALDPRFSDEFAGRHLDASKWYDHITYWDGRAPSYFDPANIRLHSGTAVIPFRNLNAIANPSFQDGLSLWQTAGGVRTVAEGSVSPMALQLDPGAEASQRIGGLRPNTDYRLSGYWKAAAGTLRVTGYDDNRSAELPVTSTGFAPFGLTFHTGPGSRSATVSVVGPASGGTAEVTMVSVVEVGENAPVGSYFSTGAIQSKVQAQYGYYEVRARIADSSSTSSFWFQGSESEIDVMECVGNSILDPGYGSIMPINLHYFPGGWANDQAFPELYDTGIRLADGFHVFGLDWRADSIRFYFDGQL